MVGAPDSGYGRASSMVLECSCHSRLPVHKEVQRGSCPSLLLLAGSDQAAIDQGSWLLGAELLFESPAPLQNFSKHRSPDPAELQHTRIVDPRWVQVAVARVREREAFLETKRKLGSRVPPSYPSDPDEKVPKGSGKGPKGKDKEKNKDKETPAK